MVNSEWIAYFQRKRFKRIVWKLSSRERFAKDVTDVHDSSSRMSQDGSRKRHLSDPSQTSSLPKAGHSDAPMNVQHDMQNQHLFDPQQISMFTTNNIENGPYMMPLLLLPNLQEYGSDMPIILNGTASRGAIGPPVGAVDIGVSKCAYYFRVALPGVKKDPDDYSLSTTTKWDSKRMKRLLCNKHYPCSLFCTRKDGKDVLSVNGEFSCEVERDGKVRIRGVTTTGAGTVSRYSRVYKMKFQQQCPPGPFTLSFTLPGPVDPRLFSPNFRSDGIFEGVIVKT